MEHGLGILLVDLGPDHGDPGLGILLEDFLPDLVDDLTVTLSGVKVLAFFLGSVGMIGSRTEFSEIGLLCWSREAMNEPYLKIISFIIIDIFIRLLEPQMFVVSHSKREI